MIKAARIVLLCLTISAQVGMFAFAWRAFQQTSEVLETTRVELKALVLEAREIIIDFGPDPPLFAPVFLTFGVCLLLAIVLLAEKVHKRER